MLKIFLNPRCEPPPTFPTPVIYTIWHRKMFFLFLNKLKSRGSPLPKCLTVLLELSWLEEFLLEGEKKLLPVPGRDGHHPKYWGSNSKKTQNPGKSIAAPSALRKPSILSLFSPLLGGPDPHDVHPCSGVECNEVFPSLLVPRATKPYFKFSGQGKLEHWCLVSLN